MSLSLVFVHGTGDSARVWDAVIARLRGETTLALDLPGHGARASQSGPAEMSVAEYAADVRETLAQQGMGGVCLIGHSLGGAIALRLAADAPELVRRLVLVGAGARLRVLPALLEGARSDPAATVRRLVELGMTDEHQALAEEHAATRAPAGPGVLHRDLAACDAFDMMGELERVRPPTLLLTGEDDRLTPVKYATYLAERLPDARLEVIPGAGHYVLLEAPDAVAGALRTWLGEDGVPGGE
jgi:pimeloyl-ACP methyl ester carboxylesterase